MAPLQKMIRDLERCIRKKVEKGESIDELKARLKQLKSTKTDADAKKKEQKNATKYHMVKFVERQKVVRKIHAVDKKLADGALVANDDREQLVDARSALVHDLAYILYFPSSMKYISLFGAVDAENDSKSHRKQQEARKIAIAEWERVKSNGEDDRVERILSEKRADDATDTTDAATSEGPKKRKFADATRSVDDSNSSGQYDGRREKKPRVSSTSGRNAPLPTTADTTPSAEGDPSVDDFFLETSGGDDGTHQPVGGRNPQRNHTTRPTSSFGKQRQKGRGSSNTPGAHKQQLRLQKWQEKHRR
jgi:hypothetical protein